MQQHFLISLTLMFILITGNTRAEAGASKPQRTPQGLKQKVTVIPRRELPPEKPFQFEIRAASLPEAPASRSVTLPKPTAVEVVFTAPKPEALTPLPEKAKNLPALPGSMPALNPEVAFSFRMPAEQPVATEAYSDSDRQMFEAFVMLDDAKKPLAALASFANLMTQSGEKSKTGIGNSNLMMSAKWGYAHAALAMGLRVQYEMTLIDMIQKGAASSSVSAWARQAYQSLVRNSDRERSLWVQYLSDNQFNQELGLAISTPASNSDLSFYGPGRDAYLLLRMHRMVAEKRVKDALTTLEKIDATSMLFGERAYYQAFLMYRQGQLNEAKSLLETAMNQQPSAFDGPEIKAKSQLLLGRLAFQSRDWRQSFEAYRSVPKNSPSWPEAMAEQALSQIMFEDFEGAAGNMFSLHTDFFKKSYSPDSYLIRTVGYLNLCQYADALKVVQDLDRKYKPILRGLEQFEQRSGRGASLAQAATNRSHTANKAKRAPASVGGSGRGNSDVSTQDETNSRATARDLEIIRQFAKNPNQSNIEGLARPFLFAWSQDPDYQRHQSRINQFSEESAAFQDLSLQIVKQEREVSQRVADLNHKLTEAIRNQESEEKQAGFRTKIDQARTELRLLQAGRKSLAAIRPQVLAGLEALKEERKALAIRALAVRRQAMTASLRQILDQSDVLLYEIYNGAGDHLRYQAAGGDVEEKKTAALQGLKEDALKWKFKGEIWEDEIGHYRSSLHSVCAKDL